MSNYNNSTLSADVVFSEAGLEKGNPISVMPFITEQEYPAIETKLTEIVRMKKHSHFEKFFQELFSEQLFFTNIQGADQYEIILNMLEKIGYNDYYVPSFTEEVIKREKLSSTCFHNHLAIPHAISQDVKKSFISICSYQKPVLWNQEPVSLIILIGISYADRKIFREVFSQLIDIVSTETKILELSQCTTYKELLTRILQSK